MQVRLARWGNSLGVRIPTGIATRIGLAEGDRIVISVNRPRYTLDELLEGVTPQEMRTAFDWGPDVGREAVES